MVTFSMTLTDPNPVFKGSDGDGDSDGGAPTAYLKSIKKYLCDKMTIERY